MHLRATLLQGLLLLSLLASGCPAPAPAELPDMTADLFPQTACRAEQPCRMYICLAPGQFMGCGTCRDPEPGAACAKDEDCKRIGADQICAADPRSCLCGGQSACQRGCTAATCGEGEVCGTDLRCQGQPCTADEECPKGFRCGASQRCERQPCKRSDGECEGGGSCVNGLCYGTPGQCTPPAA